MLQCRHIDRVWMVSEQLKETICNLVLIEYTFIDSQINPF